MGRPAHAATLGLAALLLVHTVPITVPPLSWLNVADAIDPPYPSGNNGRLMFGGWMWGRQLLFAGGMVALAAVATAVGAMAVRRGWRVDSGRKLLYGLIATAFLMLFASAAFQLASNLPVLQRVDLPTDAHDQRITLLRLTGPNRGFVVTHDTWGRPSTTRPVQMTWSYWYHPFTVGPTGIVMGTPVRYPDEPYIPWPYSSGVTNGDVAYRADVGTPEGRDDVWVANLITIDTRTGTGRVTKLWEQPADKYSQMRSTTAYLWHDRLFVIGKRLDVFDVSRPDQPRGVSDDAVDLCPPATTIYTPWADREIIALLPLPGLPAEQRLEATLRVRDAWGRPSYAFDGTVFCRTNGDTLAYRLTHLDNASATFEKIGQARPTPLQRWVSPYVYGTPSLQGGLLYVDTNGWGDTFNGSVSVFDTAGPRPMRRVGHFAAPGAQFSQPLPDGRAIVAGANKLWLVGAPKRS